jgi:hypothetical protein
MANNLTGGPRPLLLPSDSGEYDDDELFDAPTDQTPADEAEEARKAALHAKLIKFFATASEHDEPQRRREAIDLKFVRAEELTDQWPEQNLKMRGAVANEDGSVPTRPCLMINQVSQPVLMIVNEIRQSRIGVIIKPKPGQASTKEAETRQGIIRSIEAQSGAMQVRMSAVDRAVQCGRGFYRIVKDYANDGDDDLDLTIAEIPYQENVYLDPFARRADMADAEYGFILDELPKDEYKRQFGASKLAQASTDDLAGLGPSVRTWVEGETYRVAECFYAVYTPVVRVQDPQTQQWIDAKTDPKGQPILPPGAKTREVQRRSIKWCYLNALEILSEEAWEGRYVPIVAVYGRVHKVDGVVSWKGVVADAKDPQRMGNYMSSAFAEALGAAPKSPWLVDPEQIEGFETLWKDLNLYNFAYVPFHRFVNGVDYGVPQRNAQEPAVLAIAQAIRESQANVKSTTGRHGPSLGERSPAESGKAIRELKVQGELGTSDFTDSLSIAVRHEATILNDMLFPIYSTPGRIVRLLGDEDEDAEEAVLNQDFVSDDEGRPQPPPAPGLLQRFGQAAGQMMGRAPQPPPDVKHYQLTADGQFLVAVDVGRSFQQQREENVALMQTMLETVPAAAMAILPILAKNLDGPAARELSEALDAMNPAKAEEATKKLPPAAQQQIAQMQQQLQEAQALAQQVQQQLATKAQETQLKGQVEQAKGEMAAQSKAAEIASRERIAALQVQADLQKAIAALEGAEGLARLKAAEEASRQASEQAHERVLQDQKLAAEEELARLKIAATAQQQQRGVEAAQDSQRTAAQIDAESREHEGAISVVTRPPEAPNA